MKSSTSKDLISLINKIPQNKSNSNVICLTPEIFSNNTHSNTHIKGGLRNEREIIVEENNNNKRSKKKLTTKISNNQTTFMSPPKEEVIEGFNLSDISSFELGGNSDSEDDGNENNDDFLMIKIYDE